MFGWISSSLCHGASSDCVIRQIRLGLACPVCWRISNNCPLRAPVHLGTRKGTLLNKCNASDWHTCVRRGRMFHALLLSSWVKLILKDSDFLTTKNWKKCISDQMNPYLCQQISNEFVFIQLYIRLRKRTNAKTIKHEPNIT